MSQLALPLTIHCPDSPNGLFNGAIGFKQVIRTPLPRGKGIIFGGALGVTVSRTGTV